MNSLYHNIRQIFKGTRTVDNQSKYRILCIGIALIHLIFAILFGMRGVTSMCVYNVAITVFYCLLTIILVRQERYLLVFFASVAEILIYSAISSVVLGWDWGFTMYTLAMVPAAFYLTYTLPGLKRKTSVSVVTSIVVCVCFILVRAVCGRVEPFYQKLDTGNLQIYLYYFNIIIAFTVLVLFSTLFALEINYMQRQLELENLRLGEEANYDPLTRLLNRRSMNIRLRAVHEEALKCEHMFCVMLVDIDDFKKVNDTYGHDCGDEVLVSIANVIMNDVREEDAVCRWGGEEILVLLKADLDIAKKVADRICKDVRETVIQHSDMEVSVTLTIGVADYKKRQSVRSMIEEADRNMYYGKGHGKNQVVTSHDRLDDSMFK